MGSRREIFAFCAVLAVCVAAFFHETLFGGKVLSPADVLVGLGQLSRRRGRGLRAGQPALDGPGASVSALAGVQPAMIRSGRLPLWNGYAGCGAPHLANGQSAVFDPFHLLAYLGPTPQAYAWIAAGRLWMAGLGMFLLARSWGLGLWGRWFAGLVISLLRLSGRSGCCFPVTAVAIWMPWLFLATDRLFRAARRQGGRLAGHRRRT